MQDVPQLFKALSDETRLRILGLLLEGELCVCDLVAVLKTPQSTVSRHLAYLRTAGLVNGRRQGIWMHYSLAAGKKDLHKHLVDLIRGDLGSLPQVRRDRLTLRRYFSRKGAGCNG